VLIVALVIILTGCTGVIDTETITKTYTQTSTITQPTITETVTKSIATTTFTKTVTPPTTTKTVFSTKTITVPQQPTSTYIVYITNTGEKYHRSGCQYLSKSKIPIERSEAIRLGYTPCSVCKP
jgi:hypothetical protein